MLDCEDAVTMIGAADVDVGDAPTRRVVRLEHFPSIPEEPDRLGAFQVPSRDPRVIDGPSFAVVVQLVEDHLVHLVLGLIRQDVVDPILER